MNKAALSGFQMPFSVFFMKSRAESVCSSHKSIVAETPERFETVKSSLLFLFKTFYNDFFQSSTGTALSNSVICCRRVNSTLFLYIKL